MLRARSEHWSRAAGGAAESLAELARFHRPLGRHAPEAGGCGHPHLHGPGVPEHGAVDTDLRLGEPVADGLPRRTAVDAHLDGVARARARATGSRRPGAGAARRRARTT